MSYYTGMAPEPTPGAKVERYTIPFHNWGIRRTVSKMRELVRQDLKNPLLQTAADGIVPETATPEEKARRIRQFLDRTIRFKEDPPGLELIRSPLYLLDRIHREGIAEGDCDDVATLAAALGKLAGLQARFVLWSFDAGTYSHVFVELQTPAGWLEMDTTAPDQFPPGLTVRKVERIIA